MGFKKLEKGLDHHKMTGILPHRIRKIRLRSMHPYPSNFFPFLCNFLLVSMFLSLDWRAANHIFFLPQSKGNNWCLTVPAKEGKKGVVPPFDHWKLIAEIKIGIRIFESSFCVFLLQISRDLHPRISALNLS